MLQKIEIKWTRHAQDRYIERILIYGISKIEIEEAIKKQEIRKNQGFAPEYDKTKFETIGQVAGKAFVIQKAEDSKEIIVITVWEVSKEEEKAWFLKQK